MKTGLQVFLIIKDYMRVVIFPLLSITDLSLNFHVSGIDKLYLQ